jgi:D-lactate dehydrogenase
MSVDLIRIAVFSARAYDREYLSKAAATSEQAIVFDFFEARLTVHTAALAREHQGVCVFINDDVSSGVLTTLHALGVRFVALRAAGFNRVDRDGGQGARRARCPRAKVLARGGRRARRGAAAQRGAQAASRRGARARRQLCARRPRRPQYQRLHGRRRRHGPDRPGVCAHFGRFRRHAHRLRRCAHRRLHASLGGRYVDSLDELLARADVISLHCPLLRSTHHIIDAAAVAKLKPGCILINTSRGALVDTRALIDGLKSGQFAGAGIDVYEAEEAFFGQDLSDSVVQDDLFQLLQSFTNVLVTAHMAFFTKTALENIARTTVDNIVKCARNEPSPNDVKSESEKVK